MGSTPFKITKYGIVGNLTGSVQGTASYAMQSSGSVLSDTVRSVETLTSASYSAIVNPDPNTLYVITDDTASIATASFAETAKSASYALNATSASMAGEAISASYALTASYVKNAETASYVANAVSASYALNAVSASEATHAVSSSHALTASVLVNDSKYATAATAVTSASYDSTDKEIQFFNGAGTKVAFVDATDFIKDGMLASASVSASYLVLTFNTDAGQEPISMSLLDIFDPSNYYAKSDLNPFTASVTAMEAKTGSWDGKWTYDEATIQAVKVDSASNADSASYAVTASHALNVKDLPLETGSAPYSIQSTTGSVASGTASFAHGLKVTASGDYSHAEGRQVAALGQYSHAEGRQVTASGQYSHAEGYQTQASGNYSHVEGQLTIASGNYSHAEGRQSQTEEKYSHAEGYFTKASGEASHAEGWSTKAVGAGSHAEGQTTVASGRYSHAEGYNTTASGDYSHAEGDSTTASGNYSHAEGSSTTAQGSGSHAEGYYTTASGWCSHAEGRGALASGSYSHVEGSSAKALGQYSHAEGQTTVASGNYSHAKGHDSKASGEYSHAEGTNTTAQGSGSHAEGSSTTASGDYSHAEGDSTEALGWCSHAEGYLTKASNDFEHAQGKYNATASSQIFSIGCGDSDARRKNAISVITGSGPVPSASVYIYGVGGYDGTSISGSVDLANTLIGIAEAAAKKPVVLYETDGTTGLLGHNANTYEGHWQLEDYDFTPYKRLECFFKASATSSADVYTPAVVVTIPLDEAAKGPNIYMGGQMVALPFNRNREYLVGCAVDGTKTKFQVVHQNTLWDISTSNANNTGRYCYKILGYFD